MPVLLLISRACFVKVLVQTVLPRLFFDDHVRATRMRPMEQRGAGSYCLTVIAGEELDLTPKKYRPLYKEEKTRSSYSISPTDAHYYVNVCYDAVV